MRRREFVTFLGGTVAAWSLAAHAQKAALPVVAFIRDGSADGSQRYVTAFRKGLNENGFVEGQNVTVEYHWLEGQYDRLPALLARSGPPTGRRDRHARHLAHAHRQSCDSHDPDRVWHRR
jgi:hypothetical protein